MATTRKKPRGRPPLPAGTARETPVTVKLSDADIQLADGLASRFRTTRAGLLRRALHIVAAKPGLPEAPAQRSYVLEISTGSEKHRVHVQLGGEQGPRVNVASPRRSKVRRDQRKPGAPIGERSPGAKFRRSVKP